MRRVLCTLVALVAFVSFSYQAYTVTDVRQIAAASAFYTDGLNPTNIYYHADGTKYVIGSFKGTFTFNTVTYAAGNSVSDMYVLKYNADGTPAFAKVIPIHATTDALAKNLKGAVAPDGSFYITAKDNAAFTVDTVNIPAANGVLLKLGTNGVLQWYRTVTGVGLFGVRVYSDNTIAVTSMGAVAAVWKDEQSNTLFTTPYTNTGYNDMIYYRFSSAGAKIWELRSRSTQTQYIAPAPTNQFVGKDDSLYSAFVRRETAVSYSVVLEKVTAAGASAWTFRLTTSSSNIDINGVSTDANSNVYVTCTFTGTLTMAHSNNTVAGTYSQSSLFPTAFIGKYSSTGSLIWSRKLIDQAKATAAGISYNNGVLALVGYFTSPISWLDSGVTTVALNKVTSTSTTDGFILIIDSSNGNMKQAQGVASSSSDYMINVRAAGYGFDMYAFLQGAVDLGTVQIAAPPPTTAIGALFHFEDQTCHQFNTPVFGSVKPVVTASLSPGFSNQITISVTMYRQNLGNSPTPVFFNLDSKEDGSATCRITSDNIVPSAGVNWVSSTDGCSTTYTITQSLSQIVDTLAGNNKWVATLAADGRSIVYSLPIFATYSVNEDGCYFAGYKSVVTFRTALSVASTSASFVTADGAAKFTFSGLRITNDNNLEIQGNIAPMIQNSEIRAITLSKAGGGATFTPSITTCGTYSTGCDISYTASVASFGGAGTDISGQYNTVFDFFENGVSTRPGSVISYTLDYVIPSNPNVVDSDTISTVLTMHTDNNYDTIRTASYSSENNNLFIKNAISNTSPTIPTGYRLRYDRGYLCCVNYLSTIPAYNPATDTGGCRSATGKVEWADLGTEGINTAVVTHVPSNGVTPKQYNLAVTLANAFQTTNHPYPLTCEVLLISKLDNTGARKGQSANLNDVYIATTQILYEAKVSVSSASKSSVAIVFALVAAVVALVL